MPPSAGGGSVVEAFRAATGAISGSVKMTYKGKDRYGNSVYSFSYKTLSGGRPLIRTRTAAVVRTGGAFKFVTPNSAQSAQPNPIPTGGSTSPESSRSRQELLERAVGKVGELLDRGLIDDSQAKTLISGFSSWSESALTLWISRAGARTNPSSGGSSGLPIPQGTPFAVRNGTGGGLYGDLFAGDLGAGGGGGGGGFGGGGGGGGGGGLVAPPYAKPDKRTVTDYVKGVLVTKLGGVPEHLIGPGVEAFMDAHRKNFDNQVKGEMAGKDYEEVDPQMTVLEYIRNSAEYQTLHKLRPESVDEDTWVSERAQQAVQGGIANSRLEDFAITQATAGADIQDVAQAAATAEFQATGQMPSLLDNQLRQITQTMFSRVGR